MSEQMRIEAERAQLLVIDMQEKLLPKIAGHAEVVSQCSRMIRAAKELQLPITVAEQYPEGLGQMTPALVELIGNAPRMKKMTFSAWRDEALREQLVTRRRRQVMLAGIEAHVCVQQTAFDLLEAGLEPVLLADAVGSRRPEDRSVAIKRMRAAGVTVTTVESAIFETLDRCDTPLFKRLLPIIK